MSRPRISARIDDGVITYQLRGGGSVAVEYKPELRLQVVEGHGIRRAAVQVDALELRELAVLLEQIADKCYEKNDNDIHFDDLAGRL